MARIARVVVPGIPHYVTQRGNRRQETFLADDDYRAYLGFMAEGCAKRGVEVWAYCLMPSHVHLVAVPRKANGLRLAIGEAHRRYARWFNARMGWDGHLWQDRFGSFPMDEGHLLSAVRYVELDPVGAGLARTPRAYRWSSARAHLAGQDDALVTVAPMLGRVEDWRAFLLGRLESESVELIEAHARTGRPLGGEGFVARLESKLKRTLRRGRPGPKPKVKGRAKVQPRAKLGFKPKGAARK
jgi:putative transposase